MAEFLLSISAIFDHFSKMVLGIDFDNTLICYDDLIYQLALGQGLISPMTGKGKKEIRDEIRSGPMGDVAWQKIQGKIYGHAIGQAQLMPGAELLFALSTNRTIEVRIISHKTEYAGYDETRTHLRIAALEWMRSKQFFNVSGFGLDVDHVHFAATKEEKIDMIKAFNCTHFIDDLEEILLAPAFPEACVKILFAPDGRSSPSPGVTVFRDFSSICRFLVSEQCKTQ